MNSAAELEPRCPRWALGLIALAILAGGLLFARRSGADQRVYRNDFNVYYFASRQILSGTDPYQQRLTVNTPYLYPPLLAELLIPLALLPVPLSAYLWFVVNAVALVAGALMCAELVVPSPDVHQGEPTEPDEAPRARPLAPALRIRRWVALLSVLIVLRFALDCFEMGQVNCVVAALSVAHVYLYERRRPGASSLALAVAAAIKLSPVVILGYHLFKGRFTFALQCAALMALLSLGSFLPFGSRSLPAFRTFWNQTVQNGQGFDLAYSGNQSVRGALARFEHEEGTASGRIPSEPASYVIALALFVVAGLFALKGRGEPSAAAPFFCLAPLLSPLSWKGHFLILLMPIGMIVGVALLSGSAVRRMITAAAALSAGLVFVLTSPSIIGVAAADWSDSHSLILTAALLVFVTVGVVASRSFVASPR
ncbi:MAG TPA: glycosyltransferase family 87 protein [Blastocatellia bacterium]|nr:glycosyltransferase family 87 protein [Blastocatellia bacterium]